MQSKVIGMLLARDGVRSDWRIVREWEDGGYTVEGWSGHMSTSPLIPGHPDSRCFEIAIGPAEAPPAGA